MKLYDDVITHWGTLIEECPNRCNKSTDVAAWEDVGNENMVLRGEAAYELGGSDSKTYALGATAVTDNEELVPCDEIIVVGPDLAEIKSDVPYARIAIARIDGDTIGEGNVLYNAIKKVEYVRYHVNPKGFMIRVSAMTGRECVRVSKEAIENGINFEKVGATMLHQYHENPKIKAVKLVFITDPSFDFKALEKDIKLASDITKTIDHALKDINMDCNVCNLKEVCDEVEGLKELHFGNAKAEI